MDRGYRICITIKKGTTSLDMQVQLKKKQLQCFLNISCDFSVKHESILQVMLL